MKINTLTKKLLLCLTAICMMFPAIFALSACESTPDNGTTDGGELNFGDDVYAIVVVYENGSGVEGLRLMACDNGGNCFSSGARTTDERGALTFNKSDLTADEYHVKITRGLPEGYTYDGYGEGEGNAMDYYTGANLTPSNPVITITLKPVA